MLKFMMGAAADTNDPKFYGGSISRMTTATGNVDAGTGLLWDLSETDRQSMSPWHEGYYSAHPLIRTGERDKGTPILYLPMVITRFTGKTDVGGTLLKLRYILRYIFQRLLMLPMWTTEVTQGAPCTGQMLGKQPPVDYKEWWKQGMRARVRM